MHGIDTRSPIAGGRLTGEESAAFSVKLVCQFEKSHHKGHTHTQAVREPLRHPDWRVVPIYCHSDFPF